VRTHVKKSITLAIGDGANDVNMIQTAHIGVGLYGKEGNQAACFADYALPKFKDLRRLMFWHGRKFGMTFMNYTNWYIYKSYLFSVVLLYFNCFTKWSGVSMFDSLFYGFYDVDMTNFAIGFYCLFEQDVSFRYTNHEDKLNFKMSHYYKFCRDKWLQKFMKYYITWFCYAFAASVAIFFVPFLTYKYATVSIDGYTDGFYTMGFACYTLLMVAHHG
jgi:magnesium-transporting ATPase (P-type)